MLNKLNYIPEYAKLNYVKHYLLHFPSYKTTWQTYNSHNTAVYSKMLFYSPWYEMLNLYNISKTGMNILLPKFCYFSLEIYLIFFNVCSLK